MAIRPADLQLAYLAAPQNAAVANRAQEAPGVAQAANAAAFAEQVKQREESIEQTAHAEGTKIRPDQDNRDAHEHQKRRRGRRPQPFQAATPEPVDGLPGEQHTIDFIA